MYYCSNCRHNFALPEIFTECHGFSDPPFERVAVCPFCRDTNFSGNERGRRYAKR